MEFYPENFLYSTVLPKMHILDDHIVPWMRRWRLGSGLIGEQGAEFIHAHIMKLEKVHRGIPDDVERLEYIMKEHILEFDPSLTCLRLSLKKRRTQYDHVSITRVK